MYTLLLYERRYITFVISERILIIKIDSSFAIQSEILGRPILAPDSTASLARIRSWLQMCIKDHPSCKKKICSIDVDDIKGECPLPTRIRIRYR